MVSLAQISVTKKQKEHYEENQEAARKYHSFKRASFG